MRLLYFVILSLFMFLASDFILFCVAYLFRKKLPRFSFYLFCVCAAALPFLDRFPVDYCRFGYRCAKCDKWSCRLYKERHSKFDSTKGDSSK